MNKGATVLERGCRFAVWAPNADEVYVVGSFSDSKALRMVPPARLERATSGLGIQRSVQLSYGGGRRMVDG